MMAVCIQSAWFREGPGGPRLQQTALGEWAVGEVGSGSVGGGGGVKAAPHSYEVPPAQAWGWEGPGPAFLCPSGCGPQAPDSSHRGPPRSYAHGVGPGSVPALRISAGALGLVSLTVPKRGFVVKPSWDHLPALPLRLKIMLLVSPDTLLVTSRKRKATRGLTRLCHNSVVPPARVLCHCPGTRPCACAVSVLELLSQTRSRAGLLTPRCLAPGGDKTADTSAAAKLRVETPPPSVLHLTLADACGKCLPFTLAGRARDWLVGPVEGRPGGEVDGLVTSPREGRGV